MSDSASGTPSSSRRPRAARNRTLQLSAERSAELRSRLLKFPPDQFTDRIICGDVLNVTKRLPDAFADLLFLDPPYNLTKNFHGFQFNRKDHEAYRAYLRSWFLPLLRLLKPGASVYLCGDWYNSADLHDLLADSPLTIRNRICWQREKGRGASANWKNCTEDIWFATLGDDYYFDLDAVKQRKEVIAPYRNADGSPKDWQESGGGKFRLTCPSNFWDDLTVPYWSMPENTDHPTQKPEKLLAKLILASCPPGGFVLDPFLGSGTTAVTAKKLGRHYLGVEQNEEYCLWALERLARAEKDNSIQGYEDGIFLGRNSGLIRKPSRKKEKPRTDAL